MVHLARSYLNLKRNAVSSDNSGVQRLVHIRLRRGDIVLESAGDALEQLVDYAEGGIAFKLGINDNSDGVEVVYFVKALVLLEHFAVYRIYGFNSAFKGKVNVVFLKLPRTYARVFSMKFWF